MRPSVSLPVESMPCERGKRAASSRMTITEYNMTCGAELAIGSGVADDWSKEIVWLLAQRPECEQLRL